MKVVLSVWLDHRRIIHFEFLPAGETITVMKYCDQLTNLNAAIQEKQPNLVTRKSVICQHNNLRPHAAKQILHHPPYSTDLLP